MDNMDQKGGMGHHGECKYPWHGMCCGGGRRSFAWLIIKLLILAFVFWAGVKLGELKAILGYGFYGSASPAGSMMGWYAPNSFMRQMMGNWGWTYTGAPSSTTVK